MPCSLTKAEVSAIILDVLRSLHKMPQITEGTMFGRDLIVDDLAKEMYFFPIKMSVERVGCVLGKKFTMTSCRKATTVGALVKSVFDAL